ncbi:MAG: hypothetical protein ABIW19_00015 [Vicinamibacterales bacterium]
MQLVVHDRDQTFGRLFAAVLPFLQQARDVSAEALAGEREIRLRLKVRRVRGGQALARCACAAAAWP